MSKVGLALLIVGAILMVWFFSSGNTSTTTRALGEGKVRSNISDITSAVDSAGETKFLSVTVQSDNFNGDVTQAPSNFTKEVKEHIIRKNTSGANLSIKYNGEVSLDGGGSSMGITRLSNSPDIRREELKAKNNKVAGGDLLNAYGHTGIAPILKDETSCEWIEDFIYSNKGLALDRLIESDRTLYAPFESLRGQADKQKKFLATVLGDNTATSVNWNAYKSDRLIAMMQVEPSALSGVKKTEQVIELIDPNRAALYEVVHVNQNSLSKITASLETQLTLGTSKARIVNNLATHLNQVLGGKMVVVPNNDASKVMYQDEPLFVLN